MNLFPLVLNCPDVPPLNFTALLRSSSLQCTTFYRNTAGNSYADLSSAFAFTDSSVYFVFLLFLFSLIFTHRIRHSQLFSQSCSISDSMWFVYSTFWGHYSSIKHDLTLFIGLSSFLLLAHCTSNLSTNLVVKPKLKIIDHLDELFGPDYAEYHVVHRKSSCQLRQFVEADTQMARKLKRRINEKSWVFLLIYSLILKYLSA